MSDTDADQAATNLPNSNEVEREVIGNGKQLEGSGAGEKFRVIEPAVKDALSELESEEGTLNGTIVDIASFNVQNPFDNFSVQNSRFIGESHQLVQKTIDEETYTDCILIAVEIDTNSSEDVFVHPFTYQDSNNDAHDPIIDLCNELDVDISMIHHLVGETVKIKRYGNKWEIDEHRKMRRTPTVTLKHFATPIIISFLTIPLGVATGWQTGIDILIPTLIGIGVFAVLAPFSTWYYLAIQRGSPLPGILGKSITPHFIQDENKVHSDAITEVGYIEVDKIITLVDSSENVNNRAILQNLAIVGQVPHVGEVVIPVPCPYVSWNGAIAKHTVYRLASTVGNLEQSRGVLLPVMIDDESKLQVSEEVRVSEPHEDFTRLETWADAYVDGVNRLFWTPSRAETFRIRTPSTTSG